MDDLSKLKTHAGLTESKYGWKFDQFKPPFKHRKDKIVDDRGKELAECESEEVAKAFSQMLNDLHKMRDVMERLATIWK